MPDKKTEDKVVPEAIDSAGGGGASALSEQERTAANLARAASGTFGIQPVQPSGGVVGPPGGLGALPPFSSLFGPQPAAPVPTQEPVPGSGAWSALRGAGPSISRRPRPRRLSVPTVTPNSIVLRLYDEQMQRAKDAIDRYLDLLPPQVKIEARLEVLDRTDLFALGVQWGGGGLLSVNSRTAIVGRGFTADQNNTQGIGANQFTSPNSNLPLTNVIPVSGTTGLAAGGNLVNLPINSLLDGLPTGGGAGSPSASSAAEWISTSPSKPCVSRTAAQSLARPEVVVAENQKALVSLGEEIPYSTISAAETRRSSRTRR